MKFQSSQVSFDASSIGEMISTYLSFLIDVDHITHSVSLFVYAFIVTSIVPFPDNHNEVIMACNDNNLFHCNIETKEMSHPLMLASCPLTLAWQPISNQRSNESILVVGCSDGHVEFLKTNTSGKHWPLDSHRRIKAHDGAVTSIRWSHDGSSLATAGVDGEVRIWSPGGLLRTKSNFDTAVNCISWGPRCESIVVAHGKYLSITQVQGRSRSLSWDGGDGVVLAVEWNMVKDQIVSGGEDGCFRIFNSEGVGLYVSRPQSHAITSVSWFPSGNYFAVGSFHRVTLHDISGTMHDQIECSGGSSVIEMIQRQDTSQLIAGCSTGEIVVSSLVGQKDFWNGVSVELCSTSQLKIAYPINNEEIPRTIDISR